MVGGGETLTRSLRSLSSSVAVVGSVSSFYRERIVARCRSLRSRVATGVTLALLRRLITLLDGVHAIVAVHFAAKFRYGDSQLSCDTVKRHGRYRAIDFSVYEYAVKLASFRRAVKFSIARYREVVRNLIIPVSVSFLESAEGDTWRGRTDRGELNGILSRRLQPSADRATAKIAQPISVSASLGEFPNSWKSRGDITRPARISTVCFV